LACAQDHVDHDQTHEEGDFDAAKNVLETAVLPHGQKVDEKGDDEKQTDPDAGVRSHVPAGPTAELAYQVDITPPVSTRTPPPNVIIDPAAFQATNQASELPQADNSGDINNSTWVSTGRNISNIAPPVSLAAMISPDPDGTSHVPWNSEDTRPEALKVMTEKAATSATATVNTAYYNISKPTCSLNLVCYRSGAKGCELQQIQCTLRSKFPTNESFHNTIAANQHLVYTDVQFFLQMRHLFRAKMCGFFRRHFSLKFLRALQILVVSPWSF